MIGEQKWDIYTLSLSDESITSPNHISLHRLMAYNFLNGIRVRPKRALRFLCINRGIEVEGRWHGRCTAVVLASGFLYFDLYAKIGNCFCGWVNLGYGTCAA